ncbi:MAG TPA: hypothetical protein VGP93_10595 [Polyangiaceae bacterium]|nr:hypothetical protein [Polyangiaceae bacterium]
MLIASWLAACGSEPPRQANTGDDVKVDDGAPEPQSSEWLYAMRGVNSPNLRTECEAVHSAIKNESNCLGEACLYAFRLTEDWIRRCGKADAPALDEVSSLARVYNERQKGERVPCLREIASILSDGCGDKPDCADLAQEWTTRCSGVTNSPLVVRILETRVEQAAGAAGATSNVKLDKRNCVDLASGMLAAANCVQRFQCEDALPGADMYRKRCLAGGHLPSFREGLAELSLRIGAGQSPQSIAISPQAAELQAKDFTLVLADGTGVIAQACGERASDLQAYLALRKECADGQVVILQRQPGRAKSSVRVGRFAHPDDLSFTQNYPSLLARGELEARTAAGLARLSSELDAVAQKVTEDPKYDPALASAVIRALAKEATAIRAVPNGTATLQDLDARLVPLFRNLAGAKLDAAKLMFKPSDFGTFARRALKRPFADVDDEGRVGAGSFNAVSALDLEKVLPQTFTAYKNKVAPLAERAQKKPLAQAQAAALAEQLKQAIFGCASAEGKVRENEGALLECGFGDACEAQVVDDLRKELQAGRRNGGASYAAVVLTRDSMDAASDASGKAARCEQPWW